MEPALRVPRQQLPRSLVCYRGFRVTQTVPTSAYVSTPTKVDKEERLRGGCRDAVGSVV